MGVATTTVTVTDKWFDGQRQHVCATVAISASTDTYATGGLVISFAGQIPTNAIPSLVQIQGITGAVYGYSPQTTANDGKIMVFVENTVGTNTTLTEHTAAAVASTVSGDTIKLYGIFKLRS